MKLTRDEIEKCVRYTLASLDQTADRKVDEGVLEAAINEMIRDFATRASKLRPLAPGERAIVSFTKPRSAALFADRVWSTSGGEDPDMTFGWEVASEARIRAAFALEPLFAARREYPMSRSRLEQVVHDFERTIANDLRQATGADAVPLYNSASSRDAQYRPGDAAAIVAVVDHLAIVDEEHLTWEQVSEFRRDKEARSAYRAFIHWLDVEMVGKPTGYIADDIAGRLEHYQWALRKHGLQTVLGTLALTMNPKQLLGASSVGVALEMIARQPFWSLFAAGGLVVGQAAISLATILLDRRDLELSHREVAYVAEVTRHFSRPGTKRAG